MIFAINGEGDNRIQIIDSLLNTSQTITLPYPITRYIAVGLNGDIFSVSNQSNKLYRLNKSSDFSISEFDTPAPPYKVSIGQGGDIWAGTTAKTISRFDAATMTRTDFTIDSSSNIVFFCCRKDGIVVIATTSQLFKIENDVVSAIPNSNYWCDNLIADENNNLIARIGYSFYKIDSSFNFTQYANLTTSQIGTDFLAGDMTIDGQGNFYAGSYYGGIWQVNIASGAIKKMAFTDRSPAGMSFTDGFLYVVGRYNMNLKKINIATNEESVIANLELGNAYAHGDLTGQIPIFLGFSDSPPPAPAKKKNNYIISFL